MDTLIYDLLKGPELVFVRDHTNIRNVRLNDLTIEELHQIHDCLLPSIRQRHQSIYKPITALKVLLNRIEML